MAELASGAVNSLLGVIRNEAQLLGRVESDVQFIQEEMESMNSFLDHLARTTPTGGEHDEQVRTWLKQVRDLAYACSNCIDLWLYLQRGNPTVHRARRPPLGYVLWVPWYLQKLIAQHRTANQLRELKERARDVGERRLRYGVEVPTKSSDKKKKKTTAAAAALAPVTGAASPSQSQAAGVGDIIVEEEDDDDDSLAIYHSERRALAFAEPRNLEECTQKLVDWLEFTDWLATWLMVSKDRFPAVAIAAPDEEDGADVAREALAHPSVASKFDLKLPIAYPPFMPASPVYILDAILEKLELEPSENIWVRIGELDEKIGKIDNKIKEHLQAGTKRSRVVPLEPLNILRDILQDESVNEETDKLGEDQIEEKIKETAEKIKVHLESKEERSWIGLDHLEYVGILRELLPRPKEDKPVKEATDKSGDDQITKNIKEILRELLPKPQEDKSVKEDTNKLGEDQIAEKFKETTEKIIVNMLRELLPKPKEDTDKLDEDQRIEEITGKITEILKNIKEHLLIKEITEKVKEHLKGKRTMIVLDGLDYVNKWGETKRALNMLGCAIGSAVIVITKYTQGANQYCNPMMEPIKYSIVDFYHDKARRLTSPFMREDPNYDADIYLDILKECNDEFCMKIFARALYANPKRSNEELKKLHDTLVFIKGLGRDAKARKMLKFSYSDLPKEYKNCLVYLAIFPRGHKIRRSSLVGRWVAEGLVTKEDWPTSVRQAERCFDALVDLWLVYPGDLGAAGKVKNCTVPDIVHEFIIKIARKKHFVETRLSHHLAHHFSVLSDLRLRRSDTIDNFLRELHRIPHLPLVKVLDLEGCQCFEKNQHYIKIICNKMLLLKYLSLRDTNITKLPTEINNLQQLEVLDIRQTHVTGSSTKYLVLLKLKRLLAGCIHPRPSSTDITIRANESFFAVRLPHRIEKMTNMEVLFNVEISWNGANVRSIGKLWQLRKLGVVIHDKEDHLRKLVRAIGDLSGCLQSLSISIKPLQASSPGNPSNTNIELKNLLKLLESLSIRGKTSGWLLQLLVKNCGQLAKVTLCDTSLNYQDSLKDLGKLPKLRCVRLRHESYTENYLTFKKDEFQSLKYFIVEDSNITNISFEDGAAPELEKMVLSRTNITNISFEHRAAPKLEKMVLSRTNIESLCGVDGLSKLKEFELNGNRSLLPLFDNANQIAMVTLRDTLLRHGDLQILAKKPNMRCLMLLDNSCDESQLTFNKDEFPKLNLLIVDCSVITNICFDDGAAPKLEKIVWSFTMMESLSGIDKLPKLKELEFNGDLVPNLVRKAITDHPNDPVLKHNIPQNEDQGTGITEEADDEARFPFFWKK